MKDAETLIDSTDSEMVERLVDAGWKRKDAEKEVKKMLRNAEVEDRHYGE